MISIGGLQLRVTSTHRRRADASQPSIRINEHHAISNSSKKGPEDAQSLVPPREVTVLTLVHWSIQDCNGTLESRRGNRTNKTSRVCMSHRDLGGCNATRDRDPQFTSKVTTWGSARGPDVKESSGALRALRPHVNASLTELCLEKGRSRRLAQATSFGIASFGRIESQNIRRGPSQRVAGAQLLLLLPPHATRGRGLGRDHLVQENKRSHPFGFNTREVIGKLHRGSGTLELSQRGMYQVQESGCSFPVEEGLSVLICHIIPLETGVRGDMLKRETQTTRNLRVKELGGRDKPRMRRVNLPTFDDVNDVNPVSKEKNILKRGNCPQK